MGWLWVLVTGIGVLALFAAMYYGRFRNQHDTRSNIAEAEKGARDVRDEITADEERRGE